MTPLSCTAHAPAATGTTLTDLALNASGRKKRRLPRILERDVMRSILDYCAVEGIFVQRRNVGGMKKGKDYIRFAKPGQADLWGIRRGKRYGQHFECEVKRPGEEPTEEQYGWLKDCADRGALAFWADSLETFIEALNT